MADPDEPEDDDRISLRLYRACDWSQRRSWLILLLLGLTVGTVCALLGGLVTVFAFGRPVATIDAEFLAYGARMMIVALIVFSVFFVMIEVGFTLWEKRDRDFRWTRYRIESFRGRTIVAFLQLFIMVPLLIAAILVFDSDEPSGNSFSGLGFIVATIVAISIGPEVILAQLTRGNPPNRDMAD